MRHWMETGRDRTVRMLIGVIGVVFILAGLYGFVDPTLFGLFDLTTTHNWVHLATGALYAIVAFTPLGTGAVAWTARIGGIVYMLLGVAGFFAPNMLAPLLHFGVNENIFHVFMGIVLTVLGFMLPTEHVEGTHQAHTVLERRD